MQSFTVVALLIGAFVAVSAIEKNSKFNLVSIREMDPQCANTHEQQIIDLCDGILTHVAAASSEDEKCGAFKAGFQSVRDFLVKTCKWDDALIQQELVPDFWKEVQAHGVTCNH